MQSNPIFQNPKAFNMPISLQDMRLPRTHPDRKTVRAVVVASSKSGYSELHLNLSYPIDEQGGRYYFHYKLTLLTEKYQAMHNKSVETVLAEYTPAASLKSGDMECFLSHYKLAKVEALAMLPILGRACKKANKELTACLKTIAKNGQKTTQTRNNTDRAFTWYGLNDLPDDADCGKIAEFLKTVRTLISPDLADAYERARVYEHSELLDMLHQIKKALPLFSEKIANFINFAKHPQIKL